MTGIGSSYLEADNPRAKECYPPDDPFCPYGPLVSTPLPITPTARLSCGSLHDL